MKHPARVWVDPEHADEDLYRLVREYEHHLRGRANRVQEGTLDKYRKSLASFFRSLERAGEPVVLGSVTPFAVNRWVTEQRERGLSEEGIASRLSSLKVFTRKYVWQFLELTVVDLLAKVPRVAVPERPLPALTDEERSAVMEVFDRGTYEDVRNRAMLAVFVATGLRFREVLEMSLSGLDRVSGEFTVRAKGGRLRPVRLSPRALKLVKEYLRLRPSGSLSDRLWVRETGEPLGYWGAQSVFRRARERSGVCRLHAHLLRHSFAQHALQAGAERAAVMDMLGHRTDAMARRYAGTIRQETAARMMPQYSPI